MVSTIDVFVGSGEGFCEKLGNAIYMKTKVHEIINDNFSSFPEPRPIAVSNQYLTINDQGNIIWVDALD